MNKHKILTSYQLLQDCKRAIRHHTDDLQIEDFRVSWIAVIAMLRAIGHVLKNVDSKKSSVHKQVISDWWLELKETKPAPEIFWEFIEKERNRFLKEYEVGISRVVAVPNSNPGGVTIKSDVSKSSGIRITNAVLESSTLTSGFFEGRNDKEVANEAHNWWKNELDKLKDLIEKHVA